MTATLPGLAEARSADVATVDLSTVLAFVTWLNGRNGCDQGELTLRILKIGEEYGEAAQAWIGVTAQNPRKGLTHTRADVVAELADVAFTALVAITSLGHDAARALEGCASKVAARIKGGAGG